MGHDLHIICNHNLQTKSSIDLGKDINARFNIPVEVYYQHFRDYTDVLNIKYGDMNSTILLALKKPNKPNLNKNEFFHFEKCSIDDQSFQDLDAFEKYGELLLQTENGRQLYDLATQDWKDSPCYDVYLDITDQESIDLSVHHHVATPSLYFNPRWWSFSNILFKRGYINSTEEDKTESYQYLMEYRKRALEFIKCIGGHEAYYVDDQGESYHFQDNATHCTWQGTKEAIYKRYSSEVFNISEFIKSGKVIDNPDFYPPIFYDDFDDLKG
jgi:hypothetical protein